MAAGVTHARRQPTLPDIPIVQGRILTCPGVAGENPTAHGESGAQSAPRMRPVLAMIPASPPNSTAPSACTSRGKLREAFLRYDAILKAEPRHAPALHYSGVVLHQAGILTPAVERIRASAAIDPASPEAWS